MSGNARPSAAEGVRIGDLLIPERIGIRLTAISGDDLLEKLSELLGTGNPALDRQTVHRALFERECLGSTGIGHGIALPHGRLPGLPRPIGAFVTLAQDLDYHAIDCKPVTMVFALLVPDDAAEEHLLILSRLARFFQNHHTRQELLAAQTTEEIRQYFARA
ncbi:MAG: PTS sugar transporter subunit IIA [Sulfuricaulis sp.]